MKPYPKKETLPKVKDNSPKLKKCKGSGIALNHGCGKLTAHRQYGLCKSDCYPTWLFTTEAGKIKMQKAILKVQKPRLDLEAYTNTEKDRKSLKNAITTTKHTVHDYVRLRDRGKKCPCCDTEWKPEFQASHFYKAETFETLRFHLDNIHSGCPRCNLFLDGNFDNYALRLPYRIGKERYEKLTELASIDKQFSKVWNIENLKQIRENVTMLKKELQLETKQ